MPLTPASPLDLACRRMAGCSWSDLSRSMERGYVPTIRRDLYGEAADLVIAAAAAAGLRVYAPDYRAAA